MALPTSIPWSLVSFDSSNLPTLLSLGAGDLTITPSATPYFSETGGVLTASSSDGVEASLEFMVGMPSRFTLDMLVRFDALPRNLGDLNRRKMGITLADDASRGLTIYFSLIGLAASRVDDYGSAAVLPGASGLLSQLNPYMTIRVAVDSSLGVAYVYVAEGETDTPALRQIVPVEATPSTIGDRFRLFVHGTADEPSSMRISKLRLASGLVITNYPPTANAGPDRITTIGTAVRFDGRTSFDVEGTPLTYQWELIDAPEGSQYAFELSSINTEDDGDADSVTDRLSFTPGILPDWVAYGSVLRVRGEKYVVDSADNGAGLLVLTQDILPDALVDEPGRIFRQSFLVGATTDTPYALPDVQGLYRVTLVVNDGEQSSEPAEVLANVVGARIPFGIEPDVSPLWRMLGDEWDLVANKSVFEEGWRAATRILGGKLLEAWQYHYNYSIRDAQKNFMRKWLPFRTTTYEEDPSLVEVALRYGAIIATHRFDGGDPIVTGETLVLRVWTGEDPFVTEDISITFTGDTIDDILSDCNTVLAAYGIEAYSFGIRREEVDVYHPGSASTTDDGDSDGSTDIVNVTPLSIPAWVATNDSLVASFGRFTVVATDNAAGTITVDSDTIPDSLSGVEFRVYRRVQFGLRSSTRAFLILDGTAATTLGLATDTPNVVGAEDGLRVTTRSYYLGDGQSLIGVAARDDIFVINAGQPLLVDGVRSDPLDPLPGQRLTLQEDLPEDATADWQLPSWIDGEQDYARQGVYPGDLIIAEATNEDTNTTFDLRGVVVSVVGSRVAAAMDDFFGVVGEDHLTLWVRGVKRRKAIPIDAGIQSIPQLQDLIPQEAGPTLWKEQQHYVLEPFYREDDGAPIAMLQFRDAVFIDTDLEPPDIFWAELTYFDNAPNVENLFGRLTGFLRDDASVFGPEFNYISGVAGLMYSQQSGPSMFAMRVGAQILLGQPFAEVAGTILEIRADYSPTVGRLLIQDTSDTDHPSEIVRTYYYRKNPRDTSETSGLEINLETGVPLAEGDVLRQFAPLGSGVELMDVYSDPEWFVSFLRMGLITEIEKFHTFMLQFDLDLVTLANLSLLYQFIYRVKPRHTHPMIVGLRAHDEDLDLLDDLGLSLTLNLHDSFCTDGRTHTYDDYRGDGTIWASYDDGVSQYDALVDCLLDELELCFTMNWPGGAITYDTILFYGVDVENVDGTTVLDPGTAAVLSDTAGTFFTPMYDMVLPAGHYRVCAMVKSGGVLP